MSQREHRVPDAEFIGIWRDARDVSQVAALTGLTHNAARIRASRLRDRGIDLPDLRAGAALADVAWPAAKDLRDRNRDANECLNQNKAMTHLKPVDGKKKCAACIKAHRKSNNNTEQLRARAA